MRGRRASRAGLGVAAAAAVAVSLGAVRAEAAGGSAIPLVPSAEEMLAPAAPAAPARLTLHLRVRNPSGFTRRAEATADPRSPLYGRRLPWRAFDRRFAPRRALVSAIRTWARGVGLRVALVPRNRLFVVVTGPAAAVTAARAAGLPPRLLGGLLAVSGPSETPTLQPATTPPPPAPSAPGPCSKWWRHKHAPGLPEAGEGRLAWVLCGHRPHALQAAYGVADAIAGGLDGSGTTIAILGVGSSATIEKDIDRHARDHRLAPVDYESIRSPMPGQPPSEEYLAATSVEQTLDVEAAHAIAPGARILYVEMANGTRPDFLGAINDVVLNGRADAVSISFSERGENQFFSENESADQVFKLAAMRRVGIYVASGDRGDGTHDPMVGMPETNWPAASPWVTAVGGTSLALDQRGRRVLEVPWGTGRSVLGADDGSWSPPPPGAFVFGGGGGTSRLSRQPDYQAAVVPANISERWRDSGGAVPPAVPGRAVPDLAAVGDPHTGFVVGQTLEGDDGLPRYLEYRQGGTSLAAPLVAGLMSLAQERAGSPRGFANPALYLAAPQAFHDILPATSHHGVVREDAGQRPSLNTTGQTNSLCAATGYDDTTGRGTPNGLAFIATMAQPPSSSRAGSPGPGCTTRP